ncbi:Gfo/Idh/MocA family protein [Consotaella salsifontis]|uniref:Predicted dehydrogenase n=1 Tax=Consotaella salsifontis TaxID=1365950 RepID=A0A1T4RDQ3_9HYPH|nr:Gfo/Idh/MocA family oxidoreductase [Consotaella salsifontis]SKA14039.1 Predicted dehydrogenase [Consotaella salsifontis]
MGARIGVIGCGNWGRNHIRTLKEIGALCAIADRDAERAAAFGQQYGVPAMTPEEAIASDGLDALVLALPVQAHAPTARAAFEAGKDVLIEKPVALDPAEAEKTALTAAKFERIMMVGHVLRYHPIYQQVLDLVRSGRIGEPRHVISNRLALGRFFTMDAVWDLAPHDLSQVLPIAGEIPVKVETIRRKVLGDDTDSADITLSFASGMTAEIHISRISPYRDRRFSVIGSEGMLVFDDLAPEGQKLAIYAHRVWREGSGFACASAEPEFMATQTGMPLERELRHFIECVETRRAPLTGPEEAIETVRILSQASPVGA